MHFEFLVEGQIELTTLSILMEKILGKYDHPHTWRIHKHRGIGRIPDNPATPPNKRDSTLLHNLPSKLRAYGNELRRDMAVVVLVDLDDEADCITFKSRMTSLLDLCNHKPQVLFRIAIEELEAWFLGDPQALERAYPNLSKNVLDSYVQDSQCGTWETLADAISHGWRGALRPEGRRSPRVLEKKLEWAKKIAPLLDVQSNKSPSFCVFRDGIRKLANMSGANRHD